MQKNRELELIKDVCTIIEQALADLYNCQWNWQNFNAQLYPKLDAVPEEVKIRIEHFCEKYLADTIYVLGVGVPYPLLMDIVLRRRKCVNIVDLLDVNPKPVDISDIFYTIYDLNKIWHEIKCYILEHLILNNFNGGISHECTIEF